MALNAVESTIVNRGRGPEITGTRITVYDVMDYLKHGWARERIAALFRLSSRDIQAAIDYIQLHREQVEAEYQGILNRHHSYHYSAEVQAKVERCRRAAELRLQHVRERRAGEVVDAENHG